jgi:hypothetical protein
MRVRTELTDVGSGTGVTFFDNVNKPVGYTQQATDLLSLYIMFLYCDFGQLKH